MKTATVADLRNHFPKIAAWLAAGEEVRVTRRGKPLAKIVPDRPDEPPKRPDFAARRKKYWKWRTLSNEEVKAMREAEYEGTLEDLHGL
jgi:antitoxin (DNA-binding transcriptional repressor) of toxin-antitoxin stability system